MRSSLLVLLFAALLPAARAATVSCPDLAGAVQVGACPAEEELKYTFTAYCSDEGKAYRGETDVCTDFQRYRRLKDVALWEAGEGAFSAYVSCARPAAAVKSARVSSVRVAQQGKMTHLVCGYGDGLAFTHRTRAQCTLEAAGDCARDPAACKASCN